MTTIESQCVDLAAGVGPYAFVSEASALRRQWTAAAAAMMAFVGVAGAEVPKAVNEPIATKQRLRSAPRLIVVGNAADRPNLYYMTDNSGAAPEDPGKADLVAPQQLRMTLEQALVDSASGQPMEARKRFDVLRGTTMEREAAMPSAVNLVVLGRFDDARKAFRSLAGSADVREAGCAQLWLLWIDARTWRGNDVLLREQLARDTVGLRAADGLQQALLNLYAGQGSVDAVFAAIDVSIYANPQQRCDARAEAALFVSGYLQYVLGDTEAAQQLLRRELPRLAVSVARPLIQQCLQARC